jgi:D-psicose/D-tagatose/L-ribulose 3-epimerase
MKLALCNEVLSPWPLPQQCAYAAALGYDGLEIAPFTLSERPHEITDAQASAWRRVVEDHGLVVTGFHWLLVKPEGLSITSPDSALRRRTVEVMQRLTELCAAMGGKVMVHGSPKQRAIENGDTKETALARARDCFAQVAQTAAKVGVVYCVEPLGRFEAQLINTVEEAVEMVKQINHPALKTMIDCSAAGLNETQSVSQLIDRWLPTGYIANIQLNDRNRCSPGQGEDRFTPVLAALKRNNYSGTVAIEPFDYVPDGPGSAARAIGYVRGILEALP